MLWISAFCLCSRQAPVIFAQVLLALAEELGKFVPYVGGPEWAHILLEPLEELCKMDETLVREKATASIAEVTPQLPGNSVTEHFLPLVKVLTGSPSAFVQAALAIVDTCLMILGNA